MRPISEDLNIHFATPRKRQCIGSTAAKPFGWLRSRISDVKKHIFKPRSLKVDLGKFLNCNLFKRNNFAGIRKFDENNDLDLMLVTDVTEALERSKKKEEEQKQQII
ncbi:hypothetical protein RCL_jg2070.t1 [Rhizophagus clarus]|uniref:Uncharacterized protein n=1 Tax=Rhizophagus clarus TaxID=94130 RepID=A0A8H3KU39_9GLOM|nr:hypothetical protein RCL_jg2070.t1 [Rhizophagus clarus]